jgi:7-cyano-7-deazaguanine synthase
MTPPIVLFSSGLDSAVLLVDAAVRTGGAQPVYVSAGLAWEAEERAMGQRFLASQPPGNGIRPMASLNLDMRDVYPASHWAVRGVAPAFDTADSDVYIEGRNVVLLAKTAVFAARARLSTILIGPLAGNPFPDATPEFFDSMSRSLSTGLGVRIGIEAPFLDLRKAEVIRLGRSLNVRFELTLSCMQPHDGKHCGRCSKCRERLDAFRDAGLEDPAPYAEAPVR